MERALSILNTTNFILTPCAPELLLKSANNENDLFWQANAKNIIAARDYFQYSFSAYIAIHLPLALVEDVEQLEEYGAVVKIAKLSAHLLGVSIAYLGKTVLQAWNGDWKRHEVHLDGIMQEARDLKGKC